MTEPTKETPEEPTEVEPTEKPKSATFNISVSNWMAPTILLWVVVAPCTLAVLRHTIAPGLSWWEVTMPLWGLPAVVVGTVTAMAVLVIAVVLICLAIIAPIGFVVFLWMWFDNWRDARNLSEAKIRAAVVNARRGSES